MSAPTPRGRAPQPKPVVTVFDHDYNEVGTLTRVLDGKAVRRKNDTGTGQLTTTLDTPAARRLLEHDGDVVPLRIQSGGFDYWAQVTDSTQSGSESAPRLQVSFEDDYSHLRTRLGWPNAALEWFDIDLPFGVQIPPYDIVALPARNAVAHFVDANFAETPFRRAVPLVMLRPPGVLQDHSPLVVIASRMTPLAELWKQALADTGVVVDVTMWTPGMPQPRGVTLTDPTIVVDTRIGRDVSDVVEWRHDRGELIDPQVVRASQRAGTVVTGGKSAKALNDLFDTPIDLGDLGTITFGFLKNLIGSFNRFTDEEAVAAHGPFLKSEVFAAGGATAWTTDAVQALAQAYQDVKAKRRATFGVVSGLADRTYGKDFVEGDTVAAVMWGQRFTETVDATTLEWGPKGARLSHDIGSDRVDENQIAKLIRRLKEVGQVVSNLNVSN